MGMFDDGSSGGGMFGTPAPVKPQGNPIVAGLHSLEQGSSGMFGRAGNWLKEGTISNASALSQGLDYQRRRSQEAMFHKGSSDANRAALRHAIPGLEAGYNDDTLFGSGDGRGLKIPAFLQHAIRGTEDFALDTDTDPLTYETLGAAPLIEGVWKIAGALLHAGERVAPQSARFVRAGSDLARENFSLGGAKVEELRRTRGKAAKDNVLGAMTHSDAEAAHVKTLLQQRLAKSFKGLDKTQRGEVLRVLNGEAPMPKGGPIADAAKSIRKTTDDQLYLQLTNKAKGVFPHTRSGVRTDVNVKNAPPQSDFEEFMGDAGKHKPGKMYKAKVGNLPAKNYELPANLKEFAFFPGNATLKNFRRKYVAGLSPAEKGEPLSNEGFTVNPLEYQNPNLRARKDFEVDIGDPERYIGALNRSVDNASRNIGASRLQARLKEAFGGDIPQEAVAALEKTFHATGEGRSNKEIVLDGIKGVTGYGKAAKTQFSPMHALNIGSLSLLHNPMGTGKVLSTTAKLIKNRGNAEKTYELLRPGIERGAIGPAKEHELYFGKVPVLGQWSKLMSDITWGVDNAAKTEYAKSLGKGYGAGRRASEDLIDYRYPSDFSRNNLSLLSSFPTYRSQLPAAVLKGVARNPARAAALMRGSGGFLTGDEVGGHKAKSFTSVADVGRGVGDPAGFARSTLGDIQKAALTKAGLSHGRGDKFFTYGKPVDINYVLNALAGGLPEGRSILDAAGLGMFPGSNVGSDALFSLTGTGVK